MGALVKQTTQKKKKNRRVKKRKNVRNHLNSELNLIGVNAAGISSKLFSFDKLLADTNAGVFFIQETKMRKEGKIKTAHTSKYQIFERIRKTGKGGGGLALGVHHDLSPAWVGEGENEIETLSVEISVQDFKIRCVAAYGPQETGPSAEEKAKFWMQLDTEVTAADDCNTGFILQMDANVWAGPDLIPGDPNSKNSNGKMFGDFMRRNSHLTLVNSLQLCEGLITRIRRAGKNIEKSILDFFIVCDKVRPYLEKMVIDEARRHVLTNFNPIRTGGKAIESDHNTEILKLKMEYQKKKQDRIEIFNYKNIECQEQFRVLTSQTKKLSDCFQKNLSFEEQATQWKKTLDSFCHQAFRKVRLTPGRPKITKISELMEERKSLKLKMNNCVDMHSEDTLQDQIENLDEVIAKECSEENFQKIKDNFLLLSDGNDKINSNGMWNLMKKVFPKNNPPLPVAKRNIRGQIITNPDILKTLYLETYVHRLRHRPINPEFADLKKLKENLFDLRIKLAKLRVSKPWCANDLDLVLQKLKKNKSRDPHGLVNELFKPGVIGSDLKCSMLSLLNEIKRTFHLPEFVQWADITSIYKGKGQKLDLENERGIFGVSVFRSILMRLIYNDKYAIIDSNMSDSNVGARKRKNIRNHIFVINGIIHDVLSSQRKKPIDIQILDYKQCFDSMWLQETINDLYEAGVQDDKLVLLYEANREVNVAVKTPTGITNRVKLNEIILQGDVFGPIECSVTVDTFGKECLMEDKHLYYYKDEVPVPILTMVDDALAITECGYKSSMMNAFINTKTSIKKLQYGVDKCFKMHVGKTCTEEICPDLHVDGWKLRMVDEVETGGTRQVEEFTGSHAINEVQSEKYLGDILSSDGKNHKNMIARKNRGTGIITQIMTKLNDIFFGKYYFQVAFIWRNTYLISSLLTNSEAWYDLSQADIAILESVDEDFLRKIFEAPISTPIEMLYLELGVIPIRYIIQERRLNFLWYILHEDNESLINMVLKSQLMNPVKGDWSRSCLKSLEDLEIDLRIEDIESMKEENYRSMVRKKTEESALKYLNRMKEKHSKVMDISHTSLDMQPYLEADDTTIQERKFLFSLRSRMVDVKTNYRGKYTDTICPCCNVEEDQQEHLLTCTKLDVFGTLVSSTVNYDDLFGSDIPNQVSIMRILRARYKLRKKMKNCPTQGPM